MSTKAAIDMEHLARYTGGDVKVNAEILRLFESQTNDLVARLNSILAANDAKTWKEVTHSLKGAARGIGAFELADAAELCEPVDLLDREAAAAAIAEVKSQSEAVRTFITTYLRG
jgi:HPt (histidine-containing phosphotransfer) domain-containing protein